MNPGWCWVRRSRGLCPRHGPGRRRPGSRRFPTPNLAALGSRWLKRISQGSGQPAWGGVVGGPGARLWGGLAYGQVGFAGFCEVGIVAYTRNPRKRIIRGPSSSDELRRGGRRTSENLTQTTWDAPFVRLGNPLSCPSRMWYSVSATPSSAAILAGIARARGK